MPTIEIVCACGRIFRVPAASAGKSGTCNACGHRFQVPTFVPPPPPPVAVVVADRGDEDFRLPRPKVSRVKPGLVMTAILAALLAAAGASWHRYQYGAGEWPWTNLTVAQTLVRDYVLLRAPRGASIELEEWREIRYKSNPFVIRVDWERHNGWDRHYDRVVRLAYVETNVFGDRTRRRSIFLLDGTNITEISSREYWYVEVNHDFFGGPARPDDAPAEPNLIDHVMGR